MGRHVDRRDPGVEPRVAPLDHAGQGDELRAQGAGRQGGNGHGEAGRLARATESSNRVKISYEVKRGDTLASIARLYKTSVASLRTWNPRVPGDHLTAGQRLTLYRVAN